MSREDDAMRFGAGSREGDFCRLGTFACMNLAKTVQNDGRALLDGGYAPHFFEARRELEALFRRKRDFI